LRTHFQRICPFFFHFRGRFPMIAPSFYPLAFKLH
jgi:hypothetical protein